MHQTFCFEGSGAPNLKKQCLHCHGTQLPFRRCVLRNGCPCYCDIRFRQAIHISWVMEVKSSFKKSCFGCVMRIQGVILCRASPLACSRLCPNYHGLSGDDTICRYLVLKLLRWQLYSWQSWLLLISHKTACFLAGVRYLPPWVRSLDDSVFLPCLDLTWRAWVDRCSFFASFFSLWKITF